MRPHATPSFGDNLKVEVSVDAHLVRELELADRLHVVYERHQLRVVVPAAEEVHGRANESHEAFLGGELLPTGTSSRAPGEAACEL